MHRWIDDARDHLRLILQAALAAASPQALLRAIPEEDGTLVLPGGDRIRLRGRTVRLAAVGKAAGGMAAHAQRWGPFADALVVAPHDPGISGMTRMVSDHPVPTPRSLHAGEALLRLARATGPGDLLVLLFSGGASSLVEAPAVPLEDLTRTTDLLLRSDAPIQEINAVRKHLSRLKGGRLLAATRGDVLLLALSDVPPGDLSVLGSGPVSPDPTTYDDALAVLAKRGLQDAVPPTVLDHLRQGAQGRHPETLKPGDPALARVRTHVLADNDAAVAAAAAAARSLGYDAESKPGALHGEARDRGREIAQAARHLAAQQGPPAALVLGGETVVRVEGRGKGGRNQECALAAVDGLSGLDAVLGCLATDGVDGPTDAAGAVVDGHTRTRAEAAGLDGHAHLQENDAYPYFDALQDLIRTGPTGTNVRDVAVLLVRRGG